MKTLLITYLSFLTVTLIATLWAFGWVAFRFWAIKQVEILAAGIGIFLFPIQYVFRKNLSTIKWLPLYWWSNSDENTFVDNWYGVYELLDGDYERFEKMNFIQKFFLSYNWVAFRNPSWNLKHALAKNVVGIKQNVQCLKKAGTQIV